MRKKQTRGGFMQRLTADTIHESLLIDLIDLFSVCPFKLKPTASVSDSKV